MKNTTSTHFSFPIFGLTSGFIGFFFLGFLLGFAYLLTIEPQGISTSEEISEAPDPELAFNHFNNEVFYFKKSHYRQDADALVRKLYTAPQQQIEITAQEINAWANANLTAKPQFSDSADATSGSAVSITPETPVFQITPKRLHIAYPVKIDAWGKQWDSMVLSSGDFKSTTGAPDWNPDRLYLNCAPIPFRKTVYRFAKPKIIESIATHGKAEKLLTAWDLIKSIQVGEATLTITRK